MPVPGVRISTAGHSRAHISTVFKDLGVYI